MHQGDGSVSSDRSVQRRQELAGLSYDEQVASLRPSPDTSTSKVQFNLTTNSDASGGETIVGGPVGRLFNRVCCVEESRTDTAGLTFDQAQLEAYLDTELQMSENEWFRGLKLTGIAEALMSNLDTNGDGLVGWEEFKFFEGEILAQIAPGLEEGATGDEVEAAASNRFDDLSGTQEELGYKTLNSRAGEAIPPDMEHRGLLAQLAARITIDALDRDERSKPVAERSLSAEEWAGGARQIQDNRQTTS